MMLEDTYCPGEVVRGLNVHAWPLEKSGQEKNVWALSVWRDDV